MQHNSDLDLANDPILGQFSASATEATGGNYSGQPSGQRPHIDPEPDVQVRLERVLKATNPLLEAARPLLRMLSDMPKTLPGGYEVLVELREALDREVRTFQALCDKTNLRREHVLSARYCLCTAIDEAANSTEWGGGGRWASSSLAQRFHQDVRGGEKFFLLIGRLQTSPAEHANLLELMYRILGLGFEGVYGQSPDSRRQLESVRHNLLGILNSLREPVSPALSPHWQGETTGKLKLIKNFPVWVSASILGLLLFGLFAWEKYGLLTQSSQLVSEIEQVTSARPSEEAPKATPATPLRLATLLKSEIATGLVSVKDSEKFSQVTLRGDSLFAMAKAEMTNTLRPLVIRLGEEIAKVPGDVLVVGHSDSQAINLPEFPNNQVLSEKRAASVAALLVEKGVDKARIKVIGKGDSVPIASNTTPAGRAMNRRVEVWVGDAAATEVERSTPPSVAPKSLDPKGQRPSAATRRP